MGGDLEKEREISGRNCSIPPSPLQMAPPSAALLIRTDFPMVVIGLADDLSLKTEVPAESLKGRKCKAFRFDNFQKSLRDPRAFRVKIISL